VELKQRSLLLILPSSAGSRLALDPKADSFSILTRTVANQVKELLLSPQEEMRPNFPDLILAQSSCFADTTFELCVDPFLSMRQIVNEV